MNFKREKAITPLLSTRAELLCFKGDGVTVYRHCRQVFTGGLYAGGIVDVDEHGIRETSFLGMLRCSVRRDSEL